MSEDLPDGPPRATKLDYDAEDRRLRASSLGIRARLEGKGKRTKPRSDSPIRALIALDRARIQREIEDGTLTILPGRVILR